MDGEFPFCLLGSQTSQSNRSILLRAGRARVLYQVNFVLDRKTHRSYANQWRFFFSPSAKSLPAFWYYTFHFIDYQTFAFELLARNDLLGLDFPCPVIDNVCTCPMASSLVSAGQCALAGSDVIEVCPRSLTFQGDGADGFLLPSL